MPIYYANSASISDLVVSNKLDATGSLFGTAFPNTNYTVTVTGEDSRTWTIESKLAGSFVINANSNTSLNGTTYWTATQYNS